LLGATPADVCSLDSLVNPESLDAFVSMRDSLDVN